MIRIWASLARTRQITDNILLCSRKLNNITTIVTIPFNIFDYTYLLKKKSQKPSSYIVGSVQWFKPTPPEFILFVWRYSGGVEYFSVWRNNGSWLRVLGATMKRWRPIDQRVLPTRQGVSPPLWTTHSLNRSWTGSVDQTSETVSLPAWSMRGRKRSSRAKFHFFYFFTDVILFFLHAASFWSQCLDR